MTILFVTIVLFSLLPAEFPSLAVPKQTTNDPRALLGFGNAIPNELLLQSVLTRVPETVF